MLEMKLKTSRKIQKKICELSVIPLNAKDENEI